MFKTTSLSETALITCHNATFPAVLILPFPTGNNCKVLFQFPSLPTEYRFTPNDHYEIEDLRTLLQTAEDISRLQRAIQVAYRERNSK